MKRLVRKSIAVAIGVLLVAPAIMAGPSAVNGTLGGFSASAQGGQNPGDWGIPQSSGQNSAGQGKGPDAGGYGGQNNGQNSQSGGGQNAAGQGKGPDAGGYGGEGNGQNPQSGAGQNGAGQGKGPDAGGYGDGNGQNSQSGGQRGPGEQSGSGQSEHSNDGPTKNNSNNPDGDGSGTGQGEHYNDGPTKNNSNNPDGDGSGTGQGEHYNDGPTKNNSNNPDSGGGQHGNGNGNGSGNSSGSGSGSGSSGGSGSNGGGDFPPLDPSSDGQYDPANNNGDQQIPSGCAEGGSACEQCVQHNEAIVQFNRRYLHVAWSTTHKTLEYTKQAIAFGDGVSEMSKSSLSWQLTGKPQIIEAVQSLRSTYDNKYHIYINNMEQALNELKTCEQDNVAISDLYQQFSMLYLEFVKARYASPD